MMNAGNVRLILSREVRDQLRDRRTLFMIFVLPILLYPLLAISLTQVKQFRTERPIRVLLVGAGGLLGGSPASPGDGQGAWAGPPLFEDGHFAAGLCADWDRASGPLELIPIEPQPDSPDAGLMAEEAQRAVRAGQYDAALDFPADFADRLDAQRRDIRRWAAAREAGRPTPGKEPPAIPRPTILYTTANDRSQIAMARLSSALDRWTEAVGRRNLETTRLPATAARPFEVDASDVAQQTAYQGAAFWSKILPILLVVWAMTGAFYPAVDLCAGEKERGTLETLLSSPAERSEIVVGKLLCVMAFSSATAVLNLLSVGATGWLVFSRLAESHAPPPLSPLWLLAALLPVSALFSALCVALAAFAQTSKEGQYYLVPLMLVTLPLAVVPMTSGAELSLGNSLIPITGLVLLLKGLLEGSYAQVLPLVPIVLAVTGTACWLAIRWAVEQFNSEGVLFRQGERLELGLWLRRLLRDRQPTPTVAAAVLCGVLLLVLRFVADATLPPPADFADFLRAHVAMQLALILAPALLMAALLTRSPRQTLLLTVPRWPALAAAAALAVALQPVAMALRSGIQRLYPLNSEIQQALEGVEAMFARAGGGWVLLALALVPAVCEELAFRGFILSGFRRLGHRWRAIIATAVFFGLVHGVLQQSILACLLGIVLGYVAVQTGSILPGMLLHCLYNTLAVTTSWITVDTLASWPPLGAVLRQGEDGAVGCPWPVLLLGGLASAALLAWFSRLPCLRSPEEELQAAIRAAGSKPVGCCMDGVE
ncbi:MAG: ABC transporter permease subunit/CPBP intramembrane protease [Thermoguttaceae bacterium]|jgi:sodium transport system permease protein